MIGCAKAARSTSFTDASGFVAAPAAWAMIAPSQSGALDEPGEGVFGLLHSRQPEVAERETRSMIQSLSTTSRSCEPSRRWFFPHPATSIACAGTRTIVHAARNERMAGCSRQLSTEREWPNGCRTGGPVHHAGSGTLERHEVSTALMSPRSRRNSVMMFPAQGTLIVEWVA